MALRLEGPIVKNMFAGMAGLLVLGGSVVLGQGIHASNGDRFEFSSPTRTIYRDLRVAGGWPECFAWDTAPGITYHSVMSESFAPLPSGSKSLFQVTFGAQALIADGVPGFYDGIALRCEAIQDGVSVPCTGTPFEPFLTTQDTHGDGQLVYTSFHAALWTDDLINPVTVSIKVATLGSAGSLCNPSLTIEHGGGEVIEALAANDVGATGAAEGSRAKRTLPSKKRARVAPPRNVGLKGSPPRPVGAVNP
jgi:hypothetical protein